MGVVTENKSAKSIGLIAIGTMYIDQKYHFWPTFFLFRDFDRISFVPDVVLNPRPLSQRSEKPSTKSRSATQKFV